ncbi:MAG: hypothetical protein ACI4MA_03730 [Treponema sp.]
MFSSENTYEDIDKILKEKKITYTCKEYSEAIILWIDNYKGKNVHITFTKKNNNKIVKVAVAPV